MEYTKKYFNTIEEAQLFINNINKLLGIPVNDESVTKTYAEPQVNSDGIYVEYESYLEEYIN